MIINGTDANMEDFKCKALKSSDDLQRLAGNTMRYRL